MALPHMSNENAESVFKLFLPFKIFIPIIVTGDFV